MKKVLSILLCFTLIFIQAGCIGSQPEKTTVQTPVSEQITQTTKTTTTEQITTEQGTTTEQETTTEESTTEEETTKTGSKYHRSSCGYLHSSKIKISVSSARSQGYTPCKRCKP